MRNVKTLSDELLFRGYVFIPEWEVGCPTEEVANRIGTVLSIGDLLPGSGIPDVQRLIPREKSVEFSNQYSGEFGLKNFPLHTDLAHWTRPPRYFMLRCIQGSPKVSTTLCPTASITSTFGRSRLQTALVKPRKTGRYVKSILLNLAFSPEVKSALRWDSLFLTSMNNDAHEFRRFMSELGSQFIEERVVLANLGDTLLIDNWCMLHGRDSVPAGETRIIERVYMAEIGV